MFSHLDSKKVIICRCEGITLAELQEGIEKYGITEMEELKRIYRIGMGPCQGRTCERLAKMVLRSYGKDRKDNKFSPRPPLVPISFEKVAEVEE